MLFSICCFLFSLLIIALSITITFAKINKTTTSKLIYLDAGHGGFDGGCTNKDKTVIEKDLTLKATLMLASYLRKSGYIVKLTRDTDSALTDNKTTDIHKRVDLINESKATIYISIHVNSFPSTLVHGAQVFYNKKSEHNKLLASLIMNQIKQLDFTNKRTIEPIKDKYITDQTTIPGCLVELGFLSNSLDLENLLNDQYLNDLMLLITIGIIEYLDYYK